MRYYIEIPHPETGETIAGEFHTDTKMSDEEFVMAVAEFGQEQGICPSYAAENCNYKVT